MIHPFEQAGLGKAPFKCVGVSEKVIVIPGVGSKAAGSCEYCWTGIRYAYHVRGVDQREFYVGCNCIAKVDMDLNRQAKRVRREYLREKVVAVKRVSAAEKRASIRASRGAALAPHRALLERCFAERKLVYFRHALRSALKFGSVPGWKVEQIELEFRILDARRAEEARRKASQFIGQPGERHVATLTKTHSINGGSRWEPWTLSVLQDEHGNSVVTFGVCPLGKGETARCKFTVKSHRERDGEKSTQVIRIKPVK